MYGKTPRKLSRGNGLGGWGGRTRRGVLGWPLRVHKVQSPLRIGSLPKPVWGRGPLVRICGSGWRRTTVVFWAAASGPEIRSVAAPGSWLYHLAATPGVRSFASVLLGESLRWSVLRRLQACLRRAPSPAMGLSYLSRRLPDRVRAAQAVRVLATIRSVLLVDRLVCYRARAARRQDKPNRRSYRAERSRYREGWQRALATHGHQILIPGNKPVIVTEASSASPCSAKPSGAGCPDTTCDALTIRRDIAGWGAVHDDSSTIRPTDG
jgi:hypothetical protein